ncbi:hypothetical protein [Streptomyces sp. NPDC005407]|uniref:hypothetical protein n=1 Tax=Streptomyces sp. NPDC005407 TaxID=3155340 RepID=UPI0033A489FC
MLALDYRLIRLKALPDGFQTEFIETAERGQTGRGEDSVDHVEIFPMVDLDAPPGTTPSTAKSRFVICLRDTGAIVGGVNISNIVRGSLQGSLTSRRAVKPSWRWTPSGPTPR